MINNICWYMKKIELLFVSLSSFIKSKNEDKKSNEVREG